jgi:predicted membrane protein
MKSKKSKTRRLNDNQKKEKISEVNKSNFFRRCVKKFWITLAIFVAVLVLIFLLDYFFGFGLTGKVIDPNNIEDPLGIGISPDDVPETPEELANVSREYLAKEWKKLAMDSAFFGPILRVVNPILKVFCGYEFSPFLEFFVAFVVALVLLALFTNGLNVFFRNFLLSLAIGFLVNVIAVAGGSMKLIVPKIVFLLRNDWIIASFFVACFLIIGIFDYLGRYFNKKREQNALDKLVKGKDSKGVDLEDVKSTMKEAEAMKKGFDDNQDTSTWD